MPSITQHEQRSRQCLLTYKRRTSQPKGHNGRQQEGDFGQQVVAVSTILDELKRAGLKKTDHLSGYIEHDDGSESDESPASACQNCIVGQMLVDRGYQCRHPCVGMTEKAGISDAAAVQQYMKVGV